MSQPRRTLEQIFQAHVQTLALTLQPFTVVKYDYVARHFVSYLRSTFPDVRRLSQLRRDPHMLTRARPDSAAEKMHGGWRILNCPGEFKNANSR